MNYLPEDLPREATCRMEGHYWGREGGVCRYCGEQLRCGACGQFVTIESLGAHIDKYCRVKWLEYEGEVAPMPSRSNSVARVTGDAE